MPIEINVQQARDSFAALCDAATSGETVIIRRPGAEDIALVAAADLRSLEETAHLLRSPKNAERLLRAMFRALDNSRPSG
jgi:antitoxin YefM